MSRSKKRKVKPYHQGALDNFCGVLAIINAAEVALHDDPLSEGQSEALFKFLMLELSRREALEGVISFGMSCKQVVDLLTLAASWIARRKAMTIYAERPFHRQRRLKLSTIRKFFKSTNDLAIIRIVSGEFNHWVAAGDLHRSSVKLFDSHAARGIWRLKWNLWKTRKASRGTGIVPNEIILIRSLSGS